MKKNAVKDRDAAQLRTRAYRSLRERILSGVLEPGSRLSERRLAADLRLSRTPLREALRQLQLEGFLINDPTRGLRVTPLTAREAREIYPILGALEALALKLSADVVVTSIPALESINSQLAAARPAKANAIDAKFHEILTRWCPNRRLLLSIEELRSLVFRYEREYMTERELIAVSVQQHAAIIDSIRTGDIGAAAKHIENNFSFSATALIARWGGG